MEDNVEKVLGEEIIKNADNVTIMDYGREEDWLYGFISEMDSEETNPVTIASGTAVQQFGRYNKDFIMRRLIMYILISVWFIIL